MKSMNIRTWPLWLSGLFLADGLACWSAYRLIGSEVDAQGVLHEPFVLIPIGWLLLAAGVVVGGPYFAVRGVRMLRKDAQ